MNCYTTSSCAGLRVERSGFETWLVHCIVFQGETPNSHSASPYLRVILGSDELSGKPDEILWP